jgi:hypothetical protein
MADELIYKMANTDEVDEKPFLEKQLVYITDNNPSSYVSNEIMFETGSLSSNGRYNDYLNAYIVIPLVITARDSVGTADFTADHIKDSDFLVALKNTHLSLINTLSIDVNNINAIQPSSYVNMLLTYRLHSEMSLEDEQLHGATIGYGKDGTSWRYTSAASASGRGLCNNANNVAIRQHPAGGQYGGIANEGMYARQQSFFNQAGAGSDMGRNLVLGASTVLKNQGINVVENAVGYKVWYVDAILRLKDLLFFNKMPNLTKGTFIRIKMTVNQCSFDVTKSAGALLDFQASSMSIGPNAINPLMVAASNVSYRSGEKIATALAVGDITTASQFYMNGSSTLPVNKTYKFGVNVCRTTFMNGAASVTLQHSQQTCRLYCYSYTLHPTYEIGYIERPLRKFKYNDIIQYTINNVQPNSAFQTQITQGARYLQRLIIVPIMNASVHANEVSAATAFSPLWSPFTTDGIGTTSPCVISNFQVQLGGKNIFSNPIQYNYEFFLSEMQSYGMNSGLTTGLTSGRISMYDWMNNYGYLVVDLSRRYNQDEEASLSVLVSGTITSPKNMDLYCFLEYNKTCELDVTNGMFKIVGSM